VRNRILIIWLAVSAAALAQNPYGRITGTVTDAAGAVIPGASVRVVQLETNVTTTAVTNADGNYEAGNLNPGQYRLEVEHRGFKTFRRGPLEVRVMDVLEIPVKLEVGSMSETVTVTAEAPLLESTNASVGQVVDNRRIQDLPLPGGNPMYLLQLAPGVISTNPPTHGWLPHAVDSVSNMASTGTRTRASEFTLDGVPNMSQGGQASFAPPPEMVQEFRVQTAPFDASVGHFTGAYVNMVLRSGTNALHGSFVDTRLLSSAHDFFTNKFIYDPNTGPITQQKIDNAWPQVNTNRDRVSGGGPVYIPKIYDGRNRTFWTYGFDNLDRIRPERGTYTVPTAAELGGDFSALLKVGANYQIYDPNTITPAATAGRFNRQPFAGNLIPKSRLDPMAQKIAAYYALPNTTGRADGLDNYTDPNPRDIGYHSQIARLDQVAGQKHRLYGSLSWSYLLETWNRAMHNDGMGQSRNRKHRGVALGDVWMLRPNLVLDLRYGLTRFVLFERAVSLGFDLASLGYPSALVSQFDSKVTTLPEVAIDQMQTLGGTSPNMPVTTYHNFAGTMSHMRGEHSLRFGGEYRVMQENSYDMGNVSPHFDFAPAWTKGPMDNAAAAPLGQGLASFMLGIPTGGWTDKNANYAEQSGYMALFLQDDWKVTRRLTVNVGLRWEVERPTTERFNRTTRGFDFAAVNPVQAAALAQYAQSPIAQLPASQFKTMGGLLFASINGVPRTLWNTDWNNFCPRAGIAFALRPKTILRTGFGIFFDSIGTDRADVFQQGYDQRTPVQPSLDNGLHFLGTLANPFPGGLLAPPGPSAGLATFVGRAASFFDPRLRPGYSQRWTFNIQQQLPRRFMVEVGYVGNRATGLGVSTELDPVPGQYLSRSPVRDAATNNMLTLAVNNPFYGLPQFVGSNMEGKTVQTQQLLRSMPQFQGLTTSRGTGFSWYHALNLRVERRFSGGLTINGVYTWSKFMEAISRLNPSDLFLEHVISPQDRPQRVVISGIWELPLARRNKWLGGWSVQGIYQGQSGPPIAFGNVLYYGASLSTIVLPRDQRTVERWFNIADFEKGSGKALVNNIRTFPSRLTGLRADGYNNFDLSMFKTFRFKERYAVQLRLEGQDAMNHAMFNAPNAAPANTNFGMVTGVVAPEQRRINLTMKLSW
jgi:hypothetical protein